MSQLLDGELSPDDADRLHAFLNRNPEAMDWMESNQLIHDSENATSIIDVDSAWQNIEANLASQNPAPKKTGKLLQFPVLFQTLGYAAALTLFASLLWTSFISSPDAHTERYAASESVVEYVDTEIPDASPIVYTDEASGWTVVWVTEMDPMPDETS
jgi:anti-sigma factor RsiW